MPNLAEAKKHYIVMVAKDLFLRRGIDDVLIKDVAEEAHIGEATVYRYFGKKGNLVRDVAIEIQKEILPLYFSFVSNEKGIDSLKRYYDAFLRIYKENRSYYTFVKELDSYILGEKIDDVNEYEEGVKEFGKIYRSLVEKGIKDNSIRNDIDYETFFYSSTHALLGLASKLANDKAVLKQDERQDKEKEIALLISCFVTYLTAFHNDK